MLFFELNEFVEPVLKNLDAFDLGDAKSLLVGNIPNSVFRVAVLPMNAPYGKLHLIA